MGNQPPHLLLELQSENKHEDDSRTVGGRAAPPHPSQDGASEEVNADTLRR
jgi:hypothetical protein